MKTLKVFVLIGLALIVSFSCKQPVGLGARLDIEGPVVTITSPAPRKAVQAQFEITGTVLDNNKISRLLITASLNNEVFQKQWQYNKGSWEYSNDAGSVWLSFDGPKWEGKENSASWRVPIDMFIEGQTPPQDGEYTFTVQAWDISGFTDDNSLKTIVLIFDHDPPKVDISNPYIYRGNNAYEYSPLSELHGIADDADDWKNPANIGKFITQRFNLQWQIEDNFEVWSIDLRLYPHDAEVDQNPYTDLPEDYIYSYHKNLPPPPSVPEPQSSVKPNGSIMVPSLTNEAGVYDGNGVFKSPIFTNDPGAYDGDGILKGPIAEKTTIKIVAVCYDFAGNPNQERTLGYFIYWPRADEPWIVFTDGMGDPSDFDGMKIADIEENVFMVYPGRNIKATAFQAEGVSKVTYSLYECEEDGAEAEKTLKCIGDEHLTPLLIEGEEIVTVYNQPIAENTYSLVFPWEFSPPVSSAYYVVKAIAYDSLGNSGAEYQALFRVQDITFPDFPILPSPSASEPLFKSIKDDMFTLSGEVSDATDIKSLALVWINPESRNYAAMSQLSYFRDQNYAGWQDALAGKHEETRYDRDHPNRLWKLDLAYKGENLETSRKHFSYSQEISLPDDLNIGQGKQPLKSQVFLLRVENTTGKCTIITYAPQGDTLPPSIKIEKVLIPSQRLECIPGQYAMIDQFKDGDEIIISGTWKEDSTEFLDVASYLIPNIKITVNGRELKADTGGVEITFDPSNGIGASGKWTAEAVISPNNTLEPAGLKDTLVISADISDIGGNIMETGASWLIQSDTLRLLRITSGSDDTIYKQGDTIEVILEFNKPVRLKNTEKPALKLNSGTDAVAEYRDGQIGNDSRQYFDYTVDTGHSTLPGVTLNVESLVDMGNWQDDYSYPYTWITGTSDDSEEIRLTGENAHKEGSKPEGKNYYAKKLPVTTNTNDPDYQFTLGAGKRIRIDTTAPVVEDISSGTLAGSYNSGDIYINVKFSKDVIVPDTIAEANLPRLTLEVGGSKCYTLRNRNNIKVVGRVITFVYRVVQGDDSKGALVKVTGISEGVTDVAGTKLDAGVFTTSKFDLEGIYIDTVEPGIPSVKVLSENNISKVITNTVNGNTITGSSGAAEVDMANVYNEKLWLAIEGESAAARIEYSIIGSEDNYTNAPNLNNTPFELLQKGAYKIIARQIDKAGNESEWSQPVSFNWDPGNILTRISSANANGIYNHLPGRNTIVITAYFRKSVTLAEAAALEINAQSSGTNISVPITGAKSGTALNFTYTVQAGDNIPGNASLDVSNFISATVIDGEGVDVRQLVDVNNLGEAARLNGNKDIKIDTNALSAGEPVFTAGTNWTGSQGINPTDDSYWTTLEINFPNLGDRLLYKGSGNITIEQATEGFRLPAVITEAQYNRLRTVSGIDTYYTRGTNGVDSSGAADTTTKYILGYSYEPDGSNVDTDFFAEFRKAEGISISVSSQSVKIDNDNDKVIIELKDANAPQVPGAEYTVTYPEGFVRDSLGNNCPPLKSNNEVTLGGVARPFIRIFKTQDTISSVNNPSNNQPRLVAIQPLTAEVRMDTRTPGADISYTAVPTTFSAFGTNWGLNRNPDDMNSTAARPDNAAATQYIGKFEIGGGSTINNVQGLRWWVRAAALTDNDTSLEAEDIAYRTVITYFTNNMGTDQGTNLQSGDQVWIRGGDAIGSSSIPGFPFTWEDNWNSLKDNKKRAGIRLMTKTTQNGNALNNSIWRYVTWDINTTAYVDFIKGRDLTETVGEIGYTASSANIAWQYGPKRWAYQRAGWTSFKDRYPIYAGKHRWLDIGSGDNGNPTKGAINFSGTFMERPDFTDDDVSIEGANE